MRKMNLILILSLFASFFTYCAKKDAPPIGDKISFPGSIVAFNSTSFLLLNTVANGDYSDGSIQTYSVSSNGEQSFQKAISVPVHGSEIAVSPDRKLVALSFDASVSPTTVLFYNYTLPLSPVKLPLSLNFYAAGGKQSVKRIGFFTPTGGGNFYYMYGVIYSFQNDDGSSSAVPPRVFVAKIATDFSSASVMFTLSYGIGDANSLAQKSNSIIPANYQFGSSSPTFDPDHNLFIAFPTGSSGGFGDNSTYPPLPSPLLYFSGQSGANVQTCASGVTQCTQSDMRAVSLMAVDFTAILNGNPLNNSTYFAPIAWNINGLPYGATTNSLSITYASSQSNPNDANITSLNFQGNFWSSAWVNAPNLGTESSLSCYTTSNATTSSTLYNLNSVGGNALLVAKSGTNGGGDVGNGNEIFQITGLDILSSSINYIKNNRTGGVNTSGESDFNVIAKTQILDPFNTYYSAIQANTGGAKAWLNGGASPIIPYMYSRTSGVSNFNATTTAAINMSTLNFGSNTCLPYWVRNTYMGFGNFGSDSAWLSATSAQNPGNTTYPGINLDPTQPSIFSFNSNSGAQFCTDISPTANTPKVFCANFLTGAISRFSTVSSGSTIFTKY